MLEDAECGAEIGKDEYDAQVPDLRVDLLNAQFDLREAPFSVLVLLAGDDWWGVDEVVDRLHEWMDARYLDTHVFLHPTDDERERPRFWRYWRVLPPQGLVGLHVGAWPLGAIRDRVRGHDGEATFRHRIAHARSFERALVDDGTLLLKFWLHLPAKELRRRARKGFHGKGRRRQRDGWHLHDAVDEALPAAERYLRGTHTPEAPWIVVEGGDERHRDLTVTRTLRDAVVQRLASGVPPSAAAPVAGAAASADVPDALAAVDLGAELERGEYKERLDAAQDRLRELTLRARQEGVSSVLVFEGWDAAGKGGCIRRLTRAMEAQDYRVIPVSAPTDEERVRHYLWRFWRRLPRAGRMVIFDRSWYGRVLVERVEELAPPTAWRRAYDEIVDFEAQLVEHGTPVVKFFLHVDPDEQLRRFEARAKTPYKKYKLTPDDFRAREQWADYEAAANEMVARTSTDEAPWHLVPANDKRFARVQVAETVCDALARALERR